MEDVLIQHSRELLYLVGLLCLSAFFSGSETALFSLSRVHLRKYARRESALGRAVTMLGAEPSEFLGTVLFCNMLVNILFFSISATLAQEMARELSAPGVLVAVSLCSLMGVIVFGEVTPKSLAVAAPDAFLTVSAIPMACVHRIVTPIRRFLRQFTRLVDRLVRNSSDEQNAKLEEMKIILQASAEEGAFSQNETELMSEVIDLSGVKVKEFMTPRVDMVMAPESASEQDLLALSRKTGRTKIPLFREHQDQIIGVVDVRELFLRSASAKVRDCMRPPVFITAYKRADDTLKFFRDRKTHMAIVVDEYGGTAGLITMFDVLEEILGSGLTDTDGAEEIPPIQVLEENRFLLNGGLSLREWRDLLNLTDEKLPALDTVGGLVTYLLGRVPVEGDRITFDRVVMSVRRMTGRRIDQVLLEVLPEENDASGERGNGDA